MPLHASCVALETDGVLILGEAGTGKSDLVLRLMGRGWVLVADDQVELSADADGLQATPPLALRGMLEIRGLGLMRDLPVTAPSRLRLAIRLLPPGTDAPRLPEPAQFTALGHALPQIALAARENSAPDKVAMALAAACGRASMAAGAFGH